MYIVELENNVWLAPIYGDPGRTLKKENAEQFPSERLAIKAMERAKMLRPFNNARVEEVVE